MLTAERDTLMFTFPYRNNCNVAYQACLLLPFIVQTYYQTENRPLFQPVGCVFQGIYCNASIPVNLVGWVWTCGSACVGLAGGGEEGAWKRVYMHNMYWSLQIMTSCWYNSHMTVTQSQSIRCCKRTGEDSRLWRLVSCRCKRNNGTGTHQDW